jgi:predicted oxidoreductase
MENNMKEVRIVNGPINSPAIVLGCMRMPVLSPKEAANIIAAAMDLGVNFFDNATVYTDGEAEKRFGEGKALLGIPREKMIIQTKCGLHFRDRQAFDWSEKDIIESVEGSLKRMELDYLDVLLLHRPDVLYEPEEVAAAFDKLYYSGKVRYFGVSNLMPLQIALLKKYVRQPLVINQLQLSLEQSQLIDQTLYMNNKTTEMSVDRDNNTLDYCRIKDITIQAWSPLQYGFNAGGFPGGCFLDHPDFPVLNKALHELGDKYDVPIAAIAIAWILRHPAKMQAIAGTMNPDHLKDICDACKVELTRDEWYKLYIAAGKYLP